VLFELYHLAFLEAVKVEFDETPPVEKHFRSIVRTNEAEAVLVNDPVNRSVHI